MIGLEALPASTWRANSPPVVEFSTTNASALGSPRTAANAAPDRQERRANARPTATAAVMVVCLVHSASPHSRAATRIALGPRSHWAATTPPTANSRASTSTRAYPAHWYTNGDAATRPTAATAGQIPRRTRQALQPASAAMPTSDRAEIARPGQNTGPVSGTSALHMSGYSGGYGERTIGNCCRSTYRDSPWASRTASLST